MHDQLPTSKQTTAEGTLKALDRPTDSNQQGRACAIRVAGAGGADRACVPCPPALTRGGIRYGRTLEVGRRENGKMLRSYEKGRQLGDPTSPWTRFEVEIRNIDRDIPLDILTDRQKYFVGAYDCLKRLVASEPQKITTHQKEGEISLEHLTYFAKVSYGKLIQVLHGRFSPEEIIQELARPGLPRRLEKSILSGFNALSSPGAHQKKK